MTGTNSPSINRANHWQFVAFNFRDDYRDLSKRLNGMIQFNIEVIDDHIEQLEWQQARSLIGCYAAAKLIELGIEFPTGAEYEQFRVLIANAEPDTR